MPRTATAAQVATALHVKAATVRKYARGRRIPFDSTPGGHRRFDVREVRVALGLDDGLDEATGSTPALDIVPFAPVEAPTRQAEVRVTHVGRPPIEAHGTRADHAAWAQETPVV
jgi:hypothetical protein